MDRRKALKNMGLSLGYAVATPTLISLMQSCQQEKAMVWTPDFFSQEEGAAVTKLVDIILPKTDTPAASEVQVHLFIDRLANEVMDKEKQDLFRLGMSRFMEEAVRVSGKEKAEDLEAEDLEPILAEALKNTKEEEVQMFESITNYQEAVSQGKAVTLDDGIARFSFANNLRGLTIWGYSTSEYIGEEVLAYLPVPGQYIACDDVETLTGGKAWSIGISNYE
ncbi:gluconate 2-dehydrogenase subunit 3 family protein [Zeaxanthinibacter sp. PT1]|uniref:gluconate 2-dehydrogenase subunit 3 family protein n=1 Tax=Zeaxanthinibacter TaxID=561554 RepID=UPI00234A4EDA|nr:gluconate 2-dehydrogenase subunit 3 family protein [Zeaxanthinibacter sp. PT1]MDC6350418.1 gluconate 2-dehydrogenase subunit 3 family protein [Zeaxanthinibacter sp. PT1]